MSCSGKSDLIHRYFDAYRTKEREIVEGLLSDNFTFTSPYDDAIGRAAYFERCWPNSERIEKHVVEKIFERGDEAFVLYRCVIGDGREFRNTELFAFDGDRIARVDVFFGASYRNGIFVVQQ